MGSIRTAKYITKHEPRAKIIFILNQAFITNKKEKEAALTDFKEQLEINMLDQYKLLIMPRTNLCKKLVNDHKKEEDLINENELIIKTIEKDKKNDDDLPDRLELSITKR